MWAWGTVLSFKVTASFVLRVSRAIHMGARRCDTTACEKGMRPMKALKFSLSRGVFVAEEERKPVVLVGGNMGRNDGVDYSQWFARDFPDVTFYSTEGKPEVLSQHISEADAVIG